MAAPMLTPADLWDKFDDTLPLNDKASVQEEKDGIRIEKVAFDGRDTGEGRVRIYGKFAANAKNPASVSVLILPDSRKTVEDDLLRMFVRHGYSVLMVDYRGAWEDDNDLDATPRPDFHILQYYAPVSTSVDPLDGEAAGTAGEASKTAAAGAAGTATATATGTGSAGTAKATGTAGTAGTAGTGIPGATGTDSAAADAEREEVIETISAHHVGPLVDASALDTESDAEEEDEADGKAAKAAVPVPAHRPSPDEGEQLSMDLGDDQGDPDNAEYASQTDEAGLEDDADAETGPADTAAQDEASADASNTTGTGNTVGTGVTDKTDNTAAAENAASADNKLTPEGNAETAAGTQDTAKTGTDANGDAVASPEQKDAAGAETTAEADGTETDGAKNGAKSSAKNSAAPEAAATAAAEGASETSSAATGSENKSENTGAESGNAQDEQNASATAATAEPADTQEPEPAADKEYTVYPDNVKYANVLECGRNIYSAENGVDRTCWYEWVAVGLYARQYLIHRTGKENIAMVGIRDGGEVAWKIAAVRHFDCAITISAAGWKSMAGTDKYESITQDAKYAARSVQPAQQPAKSNAFGRKNQGKAVSAAVAAAAVAADEKEDRRYNFIAGLDSQVYASRVLCPVFMLCSVNDPRFDYDRAYDTFSRINPLYAEESCIAYAINFSSFIDECSVQNLFMFLNKHLKGHHVFLPRPANVNITVDEQQNLVAKVAYDTTGVCQKMHVYFAEDTTNSVVRDWMECPQVAGKKDEFYVNIYEKTQTLYVIASILYSNGFTSWSKVNVRKISGRFRNMQNKCSVIYSSRQGLDGFSAYDCDGYALGGVILMRSVRPETIKEDGVYGLYSPRGIQTYRISSPRYAPDESSLLSVDIFTEEDSMVFITVTEMKTGKEYEYAKYVVGGVWQSLVIKAQVFKYGSSSLPSFKGQNRLTMRAETRFAVNNIMWL